MNAQALKRKADEKDADIGFKISFLRKSAGMSQSELGKMLDITFQQIQKYESGKNRVSANVLFKICKIFEVSSDYFSDDITPGEDDLFEVLKRKDIINLAKECSKLSPKQIKHLLKFINYLKDN